MANNRAGVLFDGWTLVHFAIGFMMGLFLLPQGWNLGMFIIAFVVFEILEHVFIGNEVFGWSKYSYEDPLNGAIDVVVSTIGVLLAIQLTG